MTPEQSSDAVNDNPAYSCFSPGAPCPMFRIRSNAVSVRLADDLRPIRTGPFGKPRKSVPCASNLGSSGKIRLKADTRASFPFPPRRKPMSRRLRFFLPFVLLAASMPPPAQAQSPVPDLEKEIRQHAAAIESKLIAWRRDIHEHPELGEQETRTSALVAAHLTSLGLEVKTGVGNTGVVGVLKGARPGPVVALRADMDALPVKEPPGLPFASKVKMKYLGREVDVMHACGHDAHTAIMMATAEVLTAMKDKLPGTVKFIFQPAEEGPSFYPVAAAASGKNWGAKLMVQQGVLQNPKPDAVFGLHVTSGLPAGQLAYRGGPARA